MTEEVKKRKPSTKTVMVELFDNDGDIIENATAERNLKIVAEMKKVDETIIDLLRDHPNAILLKL